MWLGRQNLSKSSTKKKLLLWSVLTWLVTQSAFFLMQYSLINIHSFGMPIDMIDKLFSISFIPPLPQYILSTASTATIMLVASLYFSEKFKNSKVTKALSQMGQLSLSLYIAHLVIGFALLESINRMHNQTIGFSLFSAFVFCSFAILFSMVWLKYFKYGPFEWLFRKVTA